MPGSRRGEVAARSSAYSPASHFSIALDCEMPKAYHRPAAAEASINRHLDQVFAGAAQHAGIVPASWKRSANYGVDPSSDVQPRILTPHELKDFRQPLEILVA